MSKFLKLRCICATFPRGIVWDCRWWSWVTYGTHVIWGHHIDLVLEYSILLGWLSPEGSILTSCVLDYSILLRSCNPYGINVIWGQYIDLIIGWWVPYGTHVIREHHIDLLLDYLILLWWRVPYGNHVIWQQHIDFVLDYAIYLSGEFLIKLLLFYGSILTCTRFFCLFGWRVAYGTHFARLFWHTGGPYELTLAEGSILISCWITVKLRSPPVIGPSTWKQQKNTSDYKPPPPPGYKPSSTGWHFWTGLNVALLCVFNLKTYFDQHFRGLI